MLAQWLYPERAVSAAGHLPNGSILEEGFSRNLRRRTIPTMENEAATIKDEDKMSFFKDRPTWHGKASNHLKTACKF
jgi:hypothetical protein